MTIAKLVLMLVGLMSVTLEAKDAKVTSLLSKDRTDLPGKEGLMITVEYSPGSSDPIHRHMVGRNASQTKSAKFVVFLVKDKGAPVLLPAN